MISFSLIVAEILISGVAGRRQTPCELLKFYFMYVISLSFLQKINIFCHLICAVCGRHTSAVISCHCLRHLSSTQAQRLCFRTPWYVLPTFPLRYISLGEPGPPSIAVLAMQLLLGLSFCNLQSICGPDSPNECKSELF